MNMLTDFKNKNIYLIFNSYKNTRVIFNNDINLNYIYYNL